jgi:hypothetical protein
MALSLTKSQQQRLNGVLRPWWPKLAMWRILAVTIRGLGLLSLSIHDLVRLEAEGAGMTPTGITDILARGLVFLGFGMTFLTSALWACMIRYYGLLVRKLASKHET